MEPCKYCDENVYSSYIMSEAPYVHLSLNNWGGDVFILAHGDNDCAYSPKFCPECGRKLKGEENDEELL